VTTTDQQIFNGIGRDNIPPSGMLYENDTIFTASETNVYKMNLSTLSIPGYGSDFSWNTKDQEEVLQSDILHQSQIWRCGTLSPHTKLEKSTDID
jgi:hypothetical protein